MDPDLNVVTRREKVQNLTVEITKGTSYAGFGELVRMLYVPEPQEFAELSALIKQSIDSVKLIRGNMHKLAYVMAFSDYWISSKAMVTFLARGIRDGPVFDDFFTLLRHILEVTVEKNTNNGVNTGILGLLTDMLKASHDWETRDFWYSVVFQIGGLMLNKWPVLLASPESTEFRALGHRFLNEIKDPGFQVIVWDVVGYGLPVRDSLEYYGNLLNNLTWRDKKRYELIWALMRKINFLIPQYKKTDEMDDKLMTMLLDGHLREPFDGEGFSFQVVNIVALVNGMRMNQCLSPLQEEKLFLFTMNAFFVEAGNFAQLNSLIKLNALTDERRNEFLKLYFYTFKSKLTEELRRHKDDEQRIFAHGIRLLKHLNVVFDQMNLELMATKNHAVYQLNFSLDSGSSDHLLKFFQQCFEVLFDFFAKKGEIANLPVVSLKCSAIESLAAICEAVPPLNETQESCQFALYFGQLLAKSISRMTPPMIEAVYFQCIDVLKLDPDCFLPGYLENVIEDVEHAISFVKVLCFRFEDLLDQSFVRTKQLKRFVKVIQFCIDRTTAVKRSATFVAKVDRFVRVFVSRVEHHLFSNVFYCKLFRVINIILAWSDLMSFNLNASNDIMTPSHVFEMLQKIPPAVLHSRDCCVFYLDRVANDLDLLKVVPLLSIVVYALDWEPERALPLLIMSDTDNLMACAGFDVLCDQLNKLFVGRNPKIQELVMDLLRVLPTKHTFYRHTTKDITTRHVYCAEADQETFYLCDVEEMLESLRSLVKIKPHRSIFGDDHFDDVVSLREGATGPLLQLQDALRGCPRNSALSNLLLKLYSVGGNVPGCFFPNINGAGVELFSLLRSQELPTVKSIGEPELEVMAGLLDDILRDSYEIGLQLFSCGNLSDEIDVIRLVEFFENYVIRYAPVAPVSARTVVGEGDSLIQFRFQELTLLPFNVQKVITRLEQNSSLDVNKICRYMKAVRHSYLSVLFLCEILGDRATSSEIAAFFEQTGFEREDAFLIGALKRMNPDILKELPDVLTWDRLTFQEQVALFMFRVEIDECVTAIAKHWFELNDVFRVTASMCLRTVLYNGSNRGREVVRNHIDRLCQSFAAGGSSSVGTADSPHVLLFHILMLDPPHGMRILTSYLEMNLLHLPTDIAVNTWTNCFNVVCSHWLLKWVIDDSSFQDALAAVLGAASKFWFIYARPLELLLESDPRRTVNALLSPRVREKPDVWKVVSMLVRDGRVPGLVEALSEFKNDLRSVSGQCPFPLFLKKDLELVSLPGFLADMARSQLIDPDELLSVVDMSLRSGSFFEVFLPQWRASFRFVLNDIAMRLKVLMSNQRANRKPPFGNPPLSLFITMYEIITEKAWNKFGELDEVVKPLHNYFGEAHGSSRMITEATRNKPFDGLLQYCQSYELPISVFWLTIKSKNVYCGVDLSTLYDLYSLVSVEAQNLKHYFELTLHNMNSFPGLLRLMVDHMMTMLWTVAKHIDSIPDIDLVELLTPLYNVIAHLKTDPKTIVFQAALSNKIVFMAIRALERVITKGCALKRTIPPLFEILARAYSSSPVADKFIDLCAESLASNKDSLAFLVLKSLPRVIDMAKEPESFTKLVPVLVSLTHHEFLFMDCVQVLFHIKLRTKKLQLDGAVLQAKVLMNCLDGEFVLKEICEVLSCVSKSPNLWYRDCLINAISESLALSDKIRTETTYRKLVKDDQWVRAWINRACLRVQSRSVTPDDYFLGNVTRDLLNVYQPNLSQWTKIPSDVAMSYFSSIESVPDGLRTREDEIKSMIFRAPDTLFLAFRNLEVKKASGRCTRASVQNGLRGVGEVFNVEENHAHPSDPKGMTRFSQMRTILPHASKSRLAKLFDSALRSAKFSEIPQLLVLQDYIKTGIVNYNPSYREPPTFIQELNEILELEGRPRIDFLSRKYEPATTKPDNLNEDTVNSYFRYCLTHNIELESSATSLALTCVRKDLLLLAVKLQKAPQSLIDELRQSIRYLPLHWCHLHPDLLGDDFVHPGIKGAQEFSYACQFVIDSYQQINDMANWVIQLENNKFNELPPALEWNSFYQTLSCGNFVPPLLERVHENVISATFDLRANETAIRIVCLTDFGAQIEYVMCATAPSSPSFSLLLRLMSKLLLHSRNRCLYTPSLLSYQVDEVFWISQTSAMPLLNTSTRIGEAIERMKAKGKCVVPHYNLENCKETMSWGRHFVRSFGCLSCVKFVLERETTPPLDVFVDERRAELCVNRFVGEAREDSLHFRANGAIRRYLFPTIFESLLPRVCMSVAHCFLENRDDVLLFVSTFAEPAPSSENASKVLEKLTKPEEIEQIMSNSRRSESLPQFSWA